MIEQLTLKALDYAHDRGELHRVICPEIESNIEIEDILGKAEQLIRLGESMLKQGQKIVEEGEEMIMQIESLMSFRKRSFDKLSKTEKETRIRTILLERLGLDEIDWETREREQVIFRIFYFYFCNQCASFSLSELGRMRGKTHASVYKAVNNCIDMKETDKSFREQFNNFRELIGC